MTCMCARAGVPLLLHLTVTRQIAHCANREATRLSARSNACRPISRVEVGLVSPRPLRPFHAYYANDPWTIEEARDCACAAESKAAAAALFICPFSEDAHLLTFLTYSPVYTSAVLFLPLPASLVTRGDRRRMQIPELSLRLMQQAAARA
jgi:hypothetical protein